VEVDEVTDGVVEEKMEIFGEFSPIFSFSLFPESAKVCDVAA
jgi:hypothetical protein